MCIVAFTETQLMELLCLISQLSSRDTDFNPYFTDEETEAQRSSERQTDFPKLHASVVSSPIPSGYEQF